ncbi:MAG TPA: phage Gp37/Gp68 family protein [Phycisphaerae bacterium]|nr:phage Gp37/Gp68 family protein [Phycisphaerae bacterium]
MGLNSAIEWTESTWNPVTGCTKISPGCAHCYAERMAVRLQAMGQRNYVNGFGVTLHRQMLRLPLKWKKPQLVFVNSMSDLFHEDVPDKFIAQVFDVMKRAPWHGFQVLTKRSARLAEMAPSLPWPKNVWMGVTVENQDYIGRIDDLRKTSAVVKFISFEPLIGPVDGADLDGIDWAIVGGESGPGARAMEKEWVISLRDQCKKAKVPFFFKQWGGVRKKLAGRKLDGRFHDEMPKCLQHRPSLLFS